MITSDFFIEPVAEVYSPAVSLSSPIACVWEYFWRPGYSRMRLCARSNNVTSALFRAVPSVTAFICLHFVPFIHYNLFLPSCYSHVILNQSLCWFALLYTDPGISVHPCTNLNARVVGDGKRNSSSQYFYSYLQCVHKVPSGVWKIVARKQI
jgi:hypothetical protein